MNNYKWGIKSALKRGMGNKGCYKKHTKETRKDCV